MLRLILLLLCFSPFVSDAQSELESINETLYKYIDGTADGAPEKVAEAFDENLNLYHIREGEIVTWNGQQYIGNIKKGEKSNRIGRVVSVDYENNAAMAKIEIKMPRLKRIYTDYLLLLKKGNEWKIIHKSFTFVPYPE